MFSGSMDMESLGQILGLLLSVVGFFIFYSKTRRGILTAKLISDVGYLVQQLMIGAVTGALINIIAIFREIVFYKSVDKKWASHRIWLYIFIVLMGAAPILTWMGPVSLLPAIGSVVSVIAFYCREPQHTRIIGLAAMMPWFVYCTIIPNYGILLSMSIQLVAAVLGLIRDRKKPAAAK